MTRVENLRENLEEIFLEEFDGQAGGVCAYGDHGDEEIGARADHGDVAGVLVDGEEEIFLGIEAQRVGRLACGDGKAFAGFAVEAAIDDVDGNDAIRGGVADVHECGIGAEDGACGRGA